VPTGDGARRTAPPFAWTLNEGARRRETARFRLKDDPDDVLEATRFALRSVARRYEVLSEEIAQLDVQLDRLVVETAPKLVSLPGIGTDHAATLLTVVGDNPERLKSKASFASLCGVSPVQASSGKVVRHRLNLK
jgi:transposase